MGRLTPDQLHLIQDYIREQGISYSPLREELLDHLLSDIESRMEADSSFEEAWQQVTGQIAKNHLKQIENETMESINKRLNLNTLFAGIAISLLALSTFFKTMHWPGANIMLVSFFILSGLFLFISMIRSNIGYKEQKGRIFLTFISLGLIAYLSFLAFRLLHLPGANQLGVLSVIILAVTLPAVSFFFINSKGQLSDYVILQVLERNSMLLERIAMAMVAFGLVFNISFWAFGEAQFVGVIFFLLTIVWIGIYAYSQTWRHYAEHAANRENKALLALSTLALVLFLFPLISGIILHDSPAHIENLLRSLAIFVAPVIYIGIIMFHRKSHTEVVLAGCLFIFYFFIRLAANLDLFPLADAWMLSTGFYVAWLAILIGLFVAFRKDEYLRVLVLFMIAAHMIPNI
jgi:hypothetical protein